MPEDIVTAQRMHELLLREDFASFISKCMETVHPGSHFMANWHIDMIAHALMRCTKGEVRRLIVNLPPRHLKSLCVSVAWPAWLLGRDPSCRVLVTSYSRHLAQKHSLDTRLIMQAPWYRRVFPGADFSPDQNEKGKFTLNARGFRLAVSTQGGITGEGGNFLIVDDPQNPLHMHKREYRRKTIEWFEQVFLSRADDKTKAVVVVVMQRLHEEDLSGHLIRQGGWETLLLPAIAPKEMVFDLGYGLRVWKEGEALHPEREPLASLAQLRREMGEGAFRAQYLQAPMPEKGALIEREWLYRRAVGETTGPTIQSWDTAIKTTEASDYSVCTTWARSPDGFHLLHVHRQRLAYPALKRKAIDLAAEWQPQAILIEDKASGQSLIQDLRSESTLPVIPILPVSDKLQRLLATLSLFEAGRVLLPGSAPWLADYQEELLRFPTGAHDDQVDSTTQYLLWEKRREARTPGIRLV